MQLQPQLPTVQFIHYQLFTTPPRLLLKYMPSTTQTDVRIAVSLSLSPLNHDPPCAQLLSLFHRSSTRPQIGVINGVLLISWRQAVLQKQIDYGAKLGHVVLSLAKMELENFFKNVMPVADYFDQSDLLLAVSSNQLSTIPLAVHRSTAVYQ